MAKCTANRKKALESKPQEVIHFFFSQLYCNIINLSLLSLYFFTLPLNKKNESKVAVLIFLEKIILRYKLSNANTKHRAGLT